VGKHLAEKKEKKKKAVSRKPRYPSNHPIFWGDFFFPRRQHLSHSHTFLHHSIATNTTTLKSLDCLGALPMSAPPAWLFSNNSFISTSQQKLTAQTLTANMAKSKPGSSKKPTAAPTLSQPPAQLMNLIENFLSEHNFESAHREFTKQRVKKGWTEAKKEGSKAKEHHSLVNVFQTWETSLSKTGRGSDIKAKIDKVTKVSSSEDSSDTSSDSGSSDSDTGDNDVEMEDVEDSPSSESSSSDSDSDSDSESESESEEVENTKAGLGSNPLKRKVESSSESSSDSGSDSDSDSGSSETSARPAKRAKKDSSSGSDSGTSSDSDSGSSSESGSDSSSDSDSDSDSNSDSEAEKKAAAKTLKKAAAVPLPVGSSSDSSSDSDSDSSGSSSSSDSDSSSDKNKSAAKKKTAKKEDPKAISTNSSDSSRTLGKTSPEIFPVSTFAPLPPDPAKANNRGKGNGNGQKKAIEPFSRVRKDVFVDPRLSSNAFSGHDWGRQAHEDLIVTKGKGFTKEKNKKKKGSYRGGFIDTNAKGGIKFDD